MAINLQHHSFMPSSSSNLWSSQRSSRSHFFCKKVANVDHLLCSWGTSRKKCLMKDTVLYDNNHNLSCQLMAFSKYCSVFCKSRNVGGLLPFASADDGVTVNGSTQASTSGDVEEMRVKLDQALQTEDYSDGLVQSLHDAGRIFELSIRRQSMSQKISWFSTAWLGIDKNVWVKALSYQASVYSLLQAASEISSRGDRRDRDINVFVQRSLLRHSSPLEIMIKDSLSAKQPEAYEWFWSEQIPAVVATFVNYFEKDPRFTAATAVCGKGSLSSGNPSDISLLMLALTCMAAVTKLGPTKISCSQFSSMIPDITGRLMDMLVDFVPIRQAYLSIKDIGLCREFLVHFGPRAAAGGVKSDRRIDEVVFWVDLVQRQLQRAIDREKIWSRLTTCESIEVLERDLAIFGFFIALGRSTQSFLFANGFDVIDDPIEGYIRYLIGGSVLYYPQLSSISSYQLYVEVVCEELDWLPFYRGNMAISKQFHGHKSRQQGPPNTEAIPQVLDVCSYWMQSFIKYSKWLEDPSSVKAARFLSKGHTKLLDCMGELGILKNEMKENSAKNFVETAGSGPSSQIAQELGSFDKALENVEEALVRLEGLLQELHLSSTNSGKEHLKAACSDLERIRKLKKEAEFLEASFRAKAASLQQGDGGNLSQCSASQQPQYLKEKRRKNASLRLNRSNRVVSNPGGFWSFLLRIPTRKPDPGSSSVDETEDEHFKQDSTDTVINGSELNEIHRFELLRNELIELEERFQRSTDRSKCEEGIKNIKDGATYRVEAASPQLVQVEKRENIVGKSFDKLKGVSTDVLQGTQLLAIDVAAAMGLLRRALIGDELTEKEKKVLQRTIYDLASVIPIGVLMLLPVTAVGHAAMLAAIQRYVPALIPSTYGAERLDLLRQLEKVKELETSEVNADENNEELA
ncbi:uncharacterized protein LOC131163965 [Malania oleifera]|uniref:uncharacterized protein LOC131163965 n=1 Tax=Malania oleifera TaxID=397392 RepID=UPI0025AE04B3|nr:uncharacterized protein LOC131163965 [Malania oleifera]